MSEAISYWDAIVVGGGPAGASTAIALSRVGRSVLLLERERESSTFKIGEGLPPAVAPLLRQLDVWPTMLEDGHLPSYGNQSAWGSDNLYDTDFILNPHGHGWHLNRLRFDERLRSIAVATGATLQRDAHVTEVIQEGELWHVKTTRSKDCSTHQSFASRFLVDATGRAARLGRNLGATRLKVDNLVGHASLHRRVHDEPDHDSTTLIEAVKDGWWYTAVLPEGIRLVCFLTDADLESCQSIRQQDNYMAAMERTQHISARMQGYEMPHSFYVAPADSSYLNICHGNAWLAVGDAAAAFDPLSSQGILSALHGGIHAAKAVDAFLSGNHASGITYDQLIQEVVDVYTKSQREFYLAENRWPNEPFWQRRHHR